MIDKLVAAIQACVRSSTPTHMTTKLNKIVFTLALLFGTASALAVTDEELESDLRNLGIPPGTTAWTNQRLKIGQFRTLRTFTMVKVLGANLREKPNCRLRGFCHSIAVQAELANGEVVDLDFGPAEIWYGGKMGTFGLALKSSNPTKTYAKWGKRIVDAIAAGEVFVGMTASQAQMSWGVPSDKRTTQTRSGNHEQWIYGDPLDRASYLYLDNDRVTAIQQ